MLQDRNTNVKVDAWIKQFNEEQKVQDQRIANLEETEKTVQNADCFDGCTSAQWRDYIANNPATDIETNNFSVHNNTSEIKMGGNVELKSGSSKVEVDNSSVTNETQFTNQFSEVSKAKTEIYSGDDSTHFEAKAECGPEGKSSCIRVSADYSLLHTSTSNTDFGNYYFSNQKAEFTFPNHCFEFCCDGYVYNDGHRLEIDNATCLDGCDGNCWRDYIAAQIPAKAQDSFCFDGCDATCWKDYIDSQASSSSSITSPDGCALVTTVCDGNKIHLCDPTFTFGYCCNDPYSAGGCTLLLLSNYNSHYMSLGCNIIESGGKDKCNLIISGSGDGPVGNVICTFTYMGTSNNIIFSCSDLDTACNKITATGGKCGINYLSASTNNTIKSGNHCWEFCCDGRFLVDGSEFSVSNAACFDGCDATCWRNYIDSHAGNPSSITSPDGCALVTTICNGNQIYICDPTFTLCTIPGYIPSGPTCVLLLEGRTNCSMCITVCSDDEYNEVCTQINAFSYGERVAELFIGTDQPSGGGGVASIWSTLATEVSSRCENSICANCRNIMMSPINCICARNFSGSTNLQNIIEAFADSSHTGENCLYASTKNTIRSLCNNEICSGNHCWVFCCDGNLYKDGVCVL